MAVFKEKLKYLNNFFNPFFYINSQNKMIKGLIKANSKSSEQMMICLRKNIFYKGMGKYRQNTGSQCCIYSKRNRPFECEKAMGCAPQARPTVDWLSDLHQHIFIDLLRRGDSCGLCRAINRASVLPLPRHVRGCGLGLAPAKVQGLSVQHALRGM